jgi:hypothetical protein
MKLELPSGNWIELRGPEELTAGDKLALHSSTEVPLNSADLEDGRDTTFNFTLGTIDEQLHGVLSRIITGWSYPYVLPKDDDNTDRRGKPTYADSLLRLSLDDWNELEEATEPHMEKLRASPKGRSTTSPTSASSSRAKAVGSRRG